MSSNQKFSARDGHLKSIWQSEIAIPKAGGWNENEIYDAVIVGAGITGLTTALLLAEQGKTVVLAEAHQIGFGSTGGTSAHLNTFFDTTYPQIENNFGEDAAKLIARAGKEAFGLIERFVADYHIDCDLERKPGYLFSQNEYESKQLEDLFTSSLKAGVVVEKSKKNGVSMSFDQALRFPDQGQFHPLKYLSGLSLAFIARGGTVLQHTLIDATETESNVHVVKSGNLAIRAKNVVYATHLPPGINTLDFKCAPYRSYVIAVRLENDDYPSCLGYDMKEPYHYLRTHKIDGKNYLIIGGEDHKTGHADPEAAFKRLEAFADEHFTVANFAYRWSSQYYIPDDGLPYIGHLPFGPKGIYIATGYNGNGMIFGTLAGQIISGLICGSGSQYEKLLSPGRVKPLAGLTGFIRENADVAYHWVADRFNAEKIAALNDLPRDTGELIKIDGETLAVYKDDKDELHALNPVCTHAGCIINFNQAEKTWDCPCHGGRFSIDGEVLTGPPQKQLQKVTIDLLSR